MYLVKYLIAFSFFGLMSCATKVTHGIILEDRNLAVVAPKITRKEDVKTLLGSPSFIFDNKWYYVTTIKEYRAFFTPKVLKHDLYEISFSDETVDSINHMVKHDIQMAYVPMYKVKTTKPNLKYIYNAH